MWGNSFESKFLSEGLKVVELWKNKLLIIEWKNNSYEFEVRNSEDEDRDEWVFIYELVGIDGLGMDEEYTYCVWDNESKSLLGLERYLLMLVWLYENNELDDKLDWFIEGSIQEEYPREEVQDLVDIEAETVGDILEKEERDDKTWDLFDDIEEF